MKTPDILVVAPNFKRRLSGVTSTIIQLVPLQAKALAIVAFGPGLPARLPRLRLSQLLGLWRRPRTRPFRIWHARRNIEMLPGIVMRDLLRMPMRLVFTSASQRRHTGYTRWLIERMDAVIATSRRSGAYLTVPHQVVMHGIDTTRFHPAGDRAAARAALSLPDRPTIGCFGRIRHQKGTDLFVDAMLRILPARPGWQAIVLGRATAEHRAFEAGLKARATAAGLADRILFLGEFADPSPYYRTLDLFVAPQRWEGFGLTPLEAMASGVPVIAANVGVFADVVTPEAGAIVEPDNPAAMAEAVAEWVDDAGRRASAARQALALARRDFPLQREADAIRAVYESLWSAHQGDGEVEGGSLARRQKAEDQA